MPIVKEIKNVSEIRHTLLKYPGRVSEAAVASAVARYEQLQQKYNIVEPMPTDDDIKAEIEKDEEARLDAMDAIPFYQNNFHILVADARKRWPGRYDGHEGEKRLRKALESKSPVTAAAIKDMYIDCRRDKLMGWQEYNAQEERKLAAAADFFRWAGLYPTKQEFEHVTDLCRSTPFYGGISDLTNYSDALFAYRKRNNGILNELSENFVLSLQDLERLSELADKEKEKLKHHEKKLMRDTRKPVFGNEPEIWEHHNKIIEKMYARARNMHNAKISREYMHAIENIVLPADEKRRIVYNVVNMQAAGKHSSLIKAYIAAFDQPREPVAAEPKPMTRIMKISAYRRMNTDENAPENKKKLVEGISEDAKVPTCYIEKLLKHIEPLTSQECERIGNEYYLLKDLSHQTGHSLIKQAIDRLAHARREMRLVQNVNTAIQTAQMFA